MEKEQLPAVMVAQDIADYLNISRRRVYEYLKLEPDQGGIRHARLGQTPRVERADFFDWLEERKTGGKSK